MRVPDPHRLVLYLKKPTNKTTNQKKKISTGIVLSSCLPWHGGGVVALSQGRCPADEFMAAVSPEQAVCLGSCNCASPNMLWPLRGLWMRIAYPEHLGPALEEGRFGQSTHTHPTRALGAVRNNYSCLDGTSGNICG